MRYYGSSSLFFDGMKYFNNSKFNEARNCFKISVNSEEYRDKSLEMLFRIDMALGKFSEVREQLKDTDLEENRKKHLIAQIDNGEYNYARSLKAYKRLFMDLGDPVYLVSMYKLSLNMGDFSKASRYLKMLETLPDYQDVVLTESIFFQMIQGNYEAAVSLIKTVNKNRVSHKTLKLIEKANVIALFHMGRNPKGLAVNNHTKYTIDILLDRTDILLEHINQHKTSSNLRFMEDVDLKGLLEEARNIMSEVNPAFNYMTNSYRVQLDRPIGHNGDKLIRGLCVVALINTPKIISMYPEDYSDEFDIEGMSKSEDLRKKLNLR